MTKTSVERRAHPRHATALDLQVTPEEGGVVARVVANNISLGGLYCTSNADFPEMTRLAVRLMLPTGNGRSLEPHPVDVEAVVVRREEVRPGLDDDPRYELGLFFTGLDDGVRERIARFVDSHQPQVR